MKALAKATQIKLGLATAALVMGLGACASKSNTTQAGLVPAQTPATAEQTSVAMQSGTTTASDLPATTAATETPANNTVVTPAPNLGASSAGRAR